MVCYLATTKLIDIVTEMTDVELIISSLKLKLYLICNIIEINHLFFCVLAAPQEKGKTFGSFSGI